MEGGTLLEHLPLLTVKFGGKLHQFPWVCPWFSKVTVLIFLGRTFWGDCWNLDCKMKRGHAFQWFFFQPSCWPLVFLHCSGALASYTIERLLRVSIGCGILPPYPQYIMVSVQDLSCTLLPSSRQNKKLFSIAFVCLSHWTCLSYCDFVLSLSAGGNILTHHHTKTLPYLRNSVLKQREWSITITWSS